MSTDPLREITQALIDAETEYLGVSKRRHELLRRIKTLKIAFYDLHVRLHNNEPPEDTLYELGNYTIHVELTESENRWEAVNFQRMTRVRLDLGEIDSKHITQHHGALPASRG